MSSWTYTILPIVPTAEEFDADSPPLAPQDNHVAVAIDRLLEQFKGKPRIEAFVAALARRIQPLEDLCWQLLRERYLYQIDGLGPAEGVQIDGLGEILGEPRAGRDDDRYLNFLKVRILINLSDGKNEQLIDILELLGADTIVIEELRPARIEVYATGIDYPTEAFQAVRDAKAGGVALDFIYSTNPTDDTFRWSDLWNTETFGFLANGWSSVHSSPQRGGKLAGVFTA